VGNRFDSAFFDHSKELALAIEETLADLNIGHWVKVYDERIRRLRQSIDEGGKYLEGR
jgi:hypothetical protein